jgi:hypothetical protein
MRTWSGFIWLRIGQVVDRCEYGAVHRGISSLAEEMLALQEGLGPMGLHRAFSAVLTPVCH